MPAGASLVAGRPIGVRSAQPVAWAIATASCFIRAVTKLAPSSSRLCGPARSTAAAASTCATAGTPRGAGGAAMPGGRPPVDQAMSAGTISVAILPVPSTR